MVETRLFVWVCPKCESANPGLAIDDEYVKGAVCFNCNALVQIIPPEQVGREAS